MKYTHPNHPEKLFRLKELMTMTYFLSMLG